MLVQTVQKKSTEQTVFSNKNDVCTGFMTNIKDDRKTNIKIGNSL